MGRTPCCDKTGLKKGPWTPEEDQKLIDHIQNHGPGNWRILPKQAGLQRCGKSCRLRWTNYLRPDIKRGRFSFEEEETIIQLHSVLGNKWSAIASKLPGRTDNEIKNYWNTNIRKRLLRMGVDPETHGPRLDLLDLPSMLSSLQNPSLLNMPALLNLQTLLNPELLKLAASLVSLQNGLPNTQNPPENRIVGNTLQQNAINPDAHTASHIETPIQDVPYLTGTQVEPSSPNFGTAQSGFQVNVHNESDSSFGSYVPDHVNYYLSTDNSAFTSSNSNQSFSNNSSLSSVITTPCSSTADPLDAGLVYLNGSTNGEDEIESYLSNMLEKLENPAFLNVCSK